MKIKEVEKRTGLSSKTIRFYESKGLIKVQRNYSDYREYNEEDVQKLLRIKLLRKCGLSIQQLFDIENNKDNLEASLYQKIEELDKRDLELSNQKELCLDVIKANGDYQKLYEIIDEMDTKEYQEMMDMIITESHPSLAKQMMISIPLFGPILCMVMFLITKDYSRLWLFFLLSLLTTVILTLSWRQFFIQYRFQKTTFLKEFLHLMGMLVLLILFIVGTFGVYIVFSFMQEFIFLRGTVFLWSVERIWSYLMLLWALQLCIFVLSIVGVRLKHRDYHDYKDFFPWIKKHKWIYLVMNILVVYISFMNVTTISQNEIVDYSPTHPFGVHYSFDDIEKIETGFYKNSFFFFHNKGDFYYKIKFLDGKTISIEESQTTKKYEKNTYSELVEMDRLIMQYHPIKIASDEFFEYLTMDQEYIERFLQIIHNQ